MLRLFCRYLFLVYLCFGTLGRLCVVIVSFHGYLHLYSLRKHAYSNILTWFCNQKGKILISTHNLCLLSKIRKIMYIPVNPSFAI